MISAVSPTGQDPSPTARAQSEDEVFVHPTPDNPTSVIADRLMHLVRRSQRARARFRRDPDTELQLSANRLIATLVREGPMRMTALAAAADADLSNVSRQVAELVRNDLIERRTDPSDRRACLLAPTAAARRRYADHLRIRDDALEQTLRHWSVADKAQLARLLSHLTDDLQRHDFHPPLMDLSRSAERCASGDSDEEETA